MSYEGLPHLNWLEPPEERESARHISTQLAMLGHFMGQFASADELIAHVETVVAYGIQTGMPIEQRARVANWSIQAAHYAVLSVYHFRATIASIRANLRLCPKLKGQVDTAAIEHAFNSVDDVFPDWRELRDGVAHFADWIFSPEKLEANIAEGGFAHGVMMGRALVFTYQGKRIHQTVSPVELSKLENIKREVYGAFRKVDQRLR